MSVILAVSDKIYSEDGLPHAVVPSNLQKKSMAYNNKGGLFHYHSAYPWKFLWCPVYH